MKVTGLNCKSTFLYYLYLCEMKRITVIIATLTLCFSCGEKKVDCPLSSPKFGTGLANPVLDHLFCADPTAIEHDGRLYVYGTNDHEQYQKADTNTYEKIKTLAMMSTDDMANWTYHGLIPTGEIAPWIIASWAPSIISVPKADGSTLFSLYFSNSGWGVGVLQAKSPVGPWTSPLETSLIDQATESVKGSGAIFDPGAAVDENGDAWLSFGATQGWLAKLGPDLHSLETTPMKLPTPFHFEANELNYIGNTYVYTYNLDWTEHKPWTLSADVPGICSMVSLKSRTPLDASSWEYGGMYFKNPGLNGMGYGNNHTHIHKYQGKWYLLYHLTGLLEPHLGAHGGFRSIYIDEIEVDETTGDIRECIPTHKGVSPIRNLDPYKVQSAATAAATIGISFLQADEPGHMTAAVGTPSKEAAKPEKGILELRNVEFIEGGHSLTCRAAGKGRISFSLDSPDAPAFATISCSGASWYTETVSCTPAPGVHTLYITLSADARLDTWQFNTSVHGNYNEDR